MNWPEIKSTLVRRWPDKFGKYDWGDGSFAITNINTNMPLFESELSHIKDICEAIGAVVESRFCIETGKEIRVLWGWTICVDANARYPKLIGSKKKIYDSRAEAELAALGEWLKATEVES